MLTGGMGFLSLPRTVALTLEGFMGMNLPSGLSLLEQESTRAEILHLPSSAYPGGTAHTRKEQFSEDPLSAIAHLPAHILSPLSRCLALTGNWAVVSMALLM